MHVHSCTICHSEALSTDIPQLYEITGMIWPVHFSLNFSPLGPPIAESLRERDICSPKKKYAAILRNNDLLDLGVIHACEWPLKNLTNIFIDFKENLMPIHLVS